ncbi:tetratricopeptide repeat protein [Pendulispora rubella]|uniref:Tetratricopeptide repeat protein n=1 Tax=Pendulispora rubella TaxID=2741070 RepID=A0ABZ2LDM7_9BACT
MMREKHASTRGRVAIVLVSFLLGGCASRATTQAAADGSALLAKSASTLAHAQEGQGEFDRAERTLQSAIEQVKRDGTPEALAELHAARAWVVVHRAFYGSVDEAATRKAIDEANAVARASTNRSAIANAADAAAFHEYRDILFNGGTYTKVRREFEQVVAAYEALGDLAGQARGLFHIGLTYEQEEKRAEARPYYERSLALAERADEPDVLSYPVRHLGYLFLEQGNIEEALRYQRRCLFLRIRAGLTRNIPYTYIAVGEVEMKKGELARARLYFNDALDLGRELHSESVSVGAHNALGQVDERENQHDAAARHYQEALILAEKMKRNADVKEASENLARVYDKLGDRDRAQKHRQRAHEAEVAMKSKT